MMHHAKQPCAQNVRSQPSEVPDPDGMDVARFTEAMNAYKISSGRSFPTWSEVLEVIVSLGYHRPHASDTNSVEPSPSCA